MASRPSEPVRRLAGLIEFHSGRIPAENRCKGLPAACFVKAAQLPSTESPFRDPRTPRRTGHLPRKTQYECLSDVEVRESAPRPLVEEELVEQAIRERVV